MRAKQINHKNGADGSIKPALEKHSMFLTKSANDLGKNIGTSLAGATVQDADRATAVVIGSQNAEINTLKVTTPTTAATPSSPATEAVPGTATEIPSAMVETAAPSTITTQQPEVKTQKDYTRLILQVVILAFAIHWLRTILTK